MKTIQAMYDQIIQNLLHRAESEGNIRAIVIVGSRARVNVPADDFSDLDLIIVATDLAEYINDSAWLKALGTHWLTFTEPTPLPEVKERRILFAEGLDVDCVFFPMTTIQDSIENGISFFLADLIRRGVKVILDKEGAFAKIDLSRIETPKFIIPTEAEFSNLVQDFFYHYVWVLKKIGRGELWVAHSCLNSYLKRRLLTMIEWNARTVYGLDYDTWHDGRLIETWADPKIIGSFPTIFSRYDRTDIKQALAEILRLFQTTAQEIAKAWGYEYSKLAIDQVLEWAEIKLKV
ncbi:MAG TPA: aminoglycoside 6-adenylyltransferase [Bacillota bacterium]|nr:aminoglycoside 6-adenylyltransferase [Bacillota bacterium]